MDSRPQERHGGGWRPAATGNSAPPQPVEYRGVILNTGQGSQMPGAFEESTRRGGQIAPVDQLPEVGEGSSSPSAPQRNKLRKRQVQSDAQSDAQSVGSRTASPSSQYAPSDFSQASSSVAPNPNLPNPYHQFQQPEPFQDPQSYQRPQPFQDARSPQRLQYPATTSAGPAQSLQSQQYAQYPQLQASQGPQQFYQEAQPEPARYRQPQLPPMAPYQQDQGGQYQIYPQYGQPQRPQQIEQYRQPVARPVDPPRREAQWGNLGDLEPYQHSQPPAQVGRPVERRQTQPEYTGQYQDYIDEQPEYQRHDQAQGAQVTVQQVASVPAATEPAATSAVPLPNVAEPPVDFSSFVPPEPVHQREYQQPEAVPISPQSTATSPTVVQPSSPRDAVQELESIPLQDYPTAPQVPPPVAKVQPKQPAPPTMRQQPHPSSLPMRLVATSIMNPPAKSAIPLKSWRYGSETSWRWRFTHHYREPNCAYQPKMPPVRHCDSMGRVVEKPIEDRYIHPLDGKLRRLIVQTVDGVFEEQGLVTWRRTYVRKVSPLGVRLATWITDYHTASGTWDDFWIQVARTLPAAFGMMFFLWSFQIQPGVLDLSYDAVHCKYLGDAKVWSNLLENDRGLARTTRDNSPYTLLRPRYLCLLASDGSPGYTFVSVDQWYTDNADSGRVLEYLFVAYSSEQFLNSSDSDMKALHDIAEKAARDVRLPAFWVAGSCMPEDANLEDDIYRIADVVRGAKRMAVAVAPRTTGKDHVATPKELLQQWGLRIWTFPELLLCPADEIPIYGFDNGKPMMLHILPKQQMGKVVWEDAPVSQQLMDHYQGTINLSRLELAILALKCLYARQTTQWFAGDQSYALMGLLRLRPQIDRTDTAFQAFARVSLSNDSDRLLERYVCLMPKTLEQPWHCMDDQYESFPWDIEPTCQVAGVCHDDTIVLDGAHGACIRWKSFTPVWASTGPSFKRICAQKLMEMSFAFFIIGVALVAYAANLDSQTSGYGYYGSSYGPSTASFIVPGVLFLVLWVVIILFTPKLVRIVYGGKFHNVQARFFGLEGYLNPPTVERAIFGGAFGRLKWSVAGSPLSRSIINEHGEKIGIDPCRDANVRDKIEIAKRGKPGELRVFTLVDTYSMEITLFEAVRPPTALFVCGNEGGMQRAVGCFYDWTTQTFDKETVLRIPTESLNRMRRVPRFKMGIVRKPYPSWVQVVGYGSSGGSGGGDVV